MDRRTLLKKLAAGAAALYVSKSYAGGLLKAPYADTFKPTWESLAQYQVPEWFRDAKFGIWAHWGPQCQPERGDWYARGMYEEGSWQYKAHIEKYGHPSKFGFKDVINEWKAEQWDPQELVGLYKKAGAKYFMALANHHDNFDLYKSKHQKWNSTRMGPKKDLIAGWAKATKDHGLRFGVSVHAAHAWQWMEVAQRSDKKGPLAGVPYDGNLTKAGGVGKWWEGEDPQELYAQNHPLGERAADGGAIHGQWDWGNGASTPSKAYCEKFYQRTIELIDKYGPDAVYFDDTALPLWPVSDVGLRIAAHMYNNSIKKHGKLEAVIFGKILNEQQRKCMVWDIERGQSNKTEPLPWQTDTCIGSWHYDRGVYDRNGYKSAKTVIHTLVDVVSKNGNLMLSVPVRGNGTIDEKERAIVEGIGEWMAVNSESIYSTRPWTTFGEGPALENTAPLSAQGFNEGKGKPFTAADIRFVSKGKTLYATMLGWPADGSAVIKSLASAGKVNKVELLGHNQPIGFEQTTAGLKVTLPTQAPGKIAFVLKISGAIA
ncbi:alpha-L-fucosidase [Mucilaginibacter myungsuensis]|uniref:alpha-L-fucosidase n=1 Tax=Mucilaginibacter myungsuensis TaxID=649104 RepID=A0A929KUY3_9SPHI|nr:alpha-L-fucosidase [Mucilaginibacter myungsuensis]MBE9661647.1 alpha-L-fucosidase [Mucilaginibacter myungsuensis]MDN3597791.1 alpha-L-fucosidase [Mucilaginibacter myungsuensis]